MVLGEFDVVETPAQAAPSTGPAAPPLPPLAAPDLDRLLALQLQRELRNHAG